MDFSKEELLLCICESMAESLPQDWREAQMSVSITGKDLKSEFTYISERYPAPQIFNLKNLYPPHNAAMELQKIMDKEGTTWSNLQVVINCDGGYKVYTT